MDYFCWNEKERQINAILKFTSCFSKIKIELQFPQFIRWVNFKYTHMLCIHKHRFKNRNLISKKNFVLKSCRYKMKKITHLSDIYFIAYFVMKCSFLYKRFPNHHLYISLTNHFWWLKWTILFFVQESENFQIGKEKKNIFSTKNEIVLKLEANRIFRSST